MTRFLPAIGFAAGLISLNIGFVRVMLFLYHQWRLLGVAAGFTFVPPVLIAPIWEWIATGHYMIFVFIYVLGFGGLGLSTFAEYNTTTGYLLN